MRVSDSVFHLAVNALQNRYFLKNERKKIHLSHYLSYFGITRKQWKKYVQTDKLKVSPKTAELLQTVAKLGKQPKNPNNETLFKVIEARYK